MKVYEEKFRLVLPKSHGRSAGLHISEVIRDYAFRSKVLDAKWKTEVLIEDQNTNLMQVGLAWEQYLEASGQLPDVEFHPGEVWVDDDEFCMCGHELDCHGTGRKCNIDGCVCSGFRPMRIFMSPDGVSMIDEEDYADLFVMCDHFLHEFKFTKKSCRDFIQLLRLRGKKVLMWLWQIMAYCYALRTLAAKLHVMFINGNYSRAEGDPDAMPTPKVYRFEFTQEDLDDNWKLLRNHAREMVIRGDYGK